MIKLMITFNRATFIVFFNSATYESVQANADVIWRSERYFLVKEYAQRPPLPPPFSLLIHIIHLAQRIAKGCCNICKRCCVKKKKSSPRRSNTKFGASTKSKNKIILYL